MSILDKINELRQTEQSLRAAIQTEAKEHWRQLAVLAKAAQTLGFKLEPDEEFATHVTTQTTEYVAEDALYREETKKTLGDLIKEALNNQPTKTKTVTTGALGHIDFARRKQHINLKRMMQEIGNVTNTHETTDLRTVVVHLFGSNVVGSPHYTRLSNNVGQMLRRCSDMGLVNISRRDSSGRAHYTVTDAGKQYLATLKPVPKAKNYKILPRGAAKQGVLNAIKTGHNTTAAIASAVYGDKNRMTVNRAYVTLYNLSKMGKVQRVNTNGNTVWSIAD